MSPTTTNLGSRRELALRASGGIEITLYWWPDDNSTTIEVRQLTSEERLAFSVPPKQALDAFYHPFAHLPPASGERPPADFAPTLQ
jgi:hypothetical protein